MTIRDDDTLAKTKQPAQQQERSMSVWPFPPPGGPVPWTPAQEKAYQQKRLQEAPEAPF